MTKEISAESNKMETATLPSAETITLWAVLKFYTMYRGPRFSLLCDFYAYKIQLILEYARNYTLYIERSGMVKHTVYFIWKLVNTYLITT